MNEKVKRLGVVLLSIVLVALVFLYYAIEKSGMFIDEIYSYGLSNGDYTPFLVDLKDGDVVDMVFTSEEFTDYVTVDGIEGFDIGSVYYNQTMDVHPPLYYFLLNFASSLNRGAFTKWTGLLLNLVLYLLTLIVLYKTASKLFGSLRLSIFSVIIYGFSTMGLSTALMIRMYCLMTLLTVVLIYLLVLYDETEKWYLSVLIGAVILIGLLTHYYYVLYAFFSCLAIFIRFARKGKYMTCVVFSVSALAGVGAAVAVFPSCIDHLFADKLVSGGSAVGNIADIAGYPKSIAKYMLGLMKQMPLAVLAAVVLFALTMICIRKKGDEFKKHFKESPALAVIVSGIAAFTVAAIISPIYSERYIYNLAPVFVLLVGYLAAPICRFADGVKPLLIIKDIAVLVLPIVIVVSSALIQPDYLYIEHRDYNNAVAEHSDKPCVYFNDNFNAPLTQDLIQLMMFDEVFVTDTPDSAALADYLADKDDPDSIVVYIDVDEFWSSGYDAEELLTEYMGKSDYSSFELLYKQGLSEAYILTK